MSVDDLPVNYTVAQAMKLMNISRTHVYALKRKGKLSFIRIGNKVMIPHAEVKRILTTGTEDNTVTSQG